MTNRFSEGYCPEREDETHCVHWWDDEYTPCCSCGYNTSEVGEPSCPVTSTKCEVHGYVHGAEAEELRSGIESIIAGSSEDIDPQDLRDLLDKVDARDSLAFLETQLKGSKRGDSGSDS